MSNVCSHRLNLWTAFAILPCSTCFDDCSHSNSIPPCKWYLGSMWGRFRWWDRELRNRTGMIGNDQSEFIKFPFKVGFIRKHLKNYQVRPINRVVSSSALPQPSSSLRSWIWPNKAIFIKCKSSDENEINKLGGHFCVSTAHPHCRSSTVDSACPLHLWTVVNLQNSLTSLWSCGICREPTSMGYRPKFTRRIKSELMIVSSF